DDPVIYLEHKYLYRSIKEELPAEDYSVPIGKARICREGSDISIITYGWMVHVALEAAERASSEGISIAVLDLRTLVPLDREAILATARQTSKVILLHEDTLTGGLGGELAGIISEHAFDYLDGPLVRIAAPDTPVPFSKTLEKAFLPNAERVLEKARWLHRF
ncbi:MAG: alpha-ketoacid dehydrogenase subunit beta, partial [Bryobacterales bacterium]|nr:alpha-ketoacid dehydrogenase subunit beta [Bryobacterales bacterium]